MDANRFDQLVEGWRPRLQKAFLDAVYQLRDDVQIGLVGELLEKGDVDGALRAVGLDPLAFRDLDQAIADAYADGGDFTTKGLPPLRQPSGHRIDIRFDVRNQRAEDDLRRHSSRLITEIIADQREMVRQVLTASMEASENPRTVALNIAGRVNAATGKREGGILGLTSSQEQWVRSFQARLASGNPTEMRAATAMTLRDKRFDRTIEKAIREEKPIPAEALAKMVAAYRNRALRYRGEAIGRTEAMTALHKGAMEAARQAIEAGQVQEGAVRKVWHSASDSRVRDTHRILNGKKVGFRAEFVSPSGAKLQYPGDPAGGPAEVVNCRCWMDVKVDYLAGVTPSAPKPFQRGTLDAAAKDYVVSKGRADGKEHLAGYDLDSGEPVETIDSDQSNFVGFTPALTKLLNSPAKRIVLHHNHPSSTSLSRGDIAMMLRFPGMDEVFAHGHDGSEYRAKVKTKFGIEVYDAVQQKVFAEMAVQGRAGLLDLATAGQVVQHVISTIMARRGYLDYAARLLGKSAEAYEARRAYFDDLVDRLAGSLE
ncbi:Phage Mu protein F like protein [Kaistia soli DSM 19436]|uniref:Phage Mu protein F like protein n=1 Tax=Kaistia soli DSM 19436 TaxID=1122133 RepID=A0A1M5MR55_9HYPH|nr:phage minor head protein [Kaistia soli]SHG79697.1 Phage Mu protein F like protein [Kaistia soli DSM 19436]